MSKLTQRQTIDTAGATLARDMELTWRNWTAYIAELQAEQAAQNADSAPDADLTHDAAPIRRIAKLDPATRQTFGAVLEARRQQAQAKAEAEARQQSRPAPDGEQVYVALLQHIADELAGHVHSGGLALVWYQDQLIKFDAAAVAAGTTDADYLAAGAGNGPTRMQIIGLLSALAVALGVLMLAWNWAFAAPASDARTGLGVARVGQASVVRWDTTGALLAGTVIVPTFGTTPRPTLCVSTDAMRQANVGSTIVLTGTQAIRRYQVLPTTEGADLLLGCDATPTRGAHLIETRTHNLLDSAMVQHITVTGPDLDPQTIPPDQMAVALDLTLPGAEGGTLITVDGRRWAATTHMAIPGGTRLTYLVPLAQVAQPSGWELTGAGLPRLLTLTIPAPESRLSVLARVLTVAAAAPQLGSRDGQATLDLTLTLTLAPDAIPLTLLPSDLLISRGGASVDTRWITPRLTPGQPTTITIRVPVQTGDTLEGTLAAWRARLTIG